MSEISETVKPVVREIKSAERSPNNIGNLQISIGKDLPTSPDKVYRSVFGRAAIDDLFNCGYVRNKQSAGLVEKNRWGENVYWSRGVEGKFHNVQNGGFVIEAPFDVANQGVVKEENVTAIYSKDEDGKVINVLDDERSKKSKEETFNIEQQKIDDLEETAEIKEALKLE
ncbi:MAG: hypothetical protein PHX34_00105 [Candidatus Shapirobacteria bacterium]|nr:hypothetical protein [Candidatus Shapirobacteria bacterium]